MKRHNLKPRPCPCNGACSCGGTIKPVSEFDSPYQFNKRQYCCNRCPVQTGRKKGYRHVKAAPKPYKQSAIDRYLMGAKP